MKVEDKPMTMPSAEKTEEVWHPENDFRTGILTVFQPPRSDERGPPGNRPFSARISQQLRRPATPSVSRILRRAARSRVRLTDRAPNLKQRASEPPYSLS
jgi:hypothetical protein